MLHKSVFRFHCEKPQTGDLTDSPSDTGRNTASSMFELYESYVDPSFFLCLNFEDCGWRREGHLKWGFGSAMGQSFVLFS